MLNLKLFLDSLLKNTNVFFYAIDCTNRLIIIFIGNTRLELSLLHRDKYYCKINNFYVRYGNFDKVGNIYNFFNNEEKDIHNNNYEWIIELFRKYESIIYKLFILEIDNLYKTEFTKINSTKKILFIDDCSNGMEQTIEDSVLNFCFNSSIELIVLYKFGKEFDYTCYFDDIKTNFKKNKYIRNEFLDDNYIDSLIDKDTEVISLNYDYKGNYNNVSLIVLHKISNIVYGQYKNIFSMYKSKTVGYSITEFKNKSKVYKFLNPQNIYLFNNISIINKSKEYIFSGGMSNNRDFKLLKEIDKSNTGILLTDKKYKIDNFHQLNEMDNYYAFYFLFKSCKFTIHPILNTSGIDDRTKMIATSIAAGKPVIIPDNGGLIQKEIEKHKLGLVYKYGDIEDFKNKINIFINDSKLLTKYSNNCVKYSEKNLNINKTVNFIFSKIL